MQNLLTLLTLPFHCATSSAHSNRATEVEIRISYPTRSMNPSFDCSGILQLIFNYYLGKADIVSQIVRCIATQ